MRRSEKSIAKGILALLNDLPGCYAYKRKGGPHRRGEPDISGCIDGKRIEIEVKAEGGKLTALQRNTLDKWSQVNCITMVAYNEWEVLQILKSHITPALFEKLNRQYMKKSIDTISCV